MAGIGAAIKGIGKVLSKFKKPKSKYIGTDKRKFDPTDDGGPYVRRKIAQAKKGKYPAIDKALKNIKKSGNIFGE